MSSLVGFQFLVRLNGHPGGTSARVVKCLGACARRGPPAGGSRPEVVPVSCGWKKAPPPEKLDSLEELLSRYSLVEKAGQGSFGKVYKAVHKTSGVVLAVKEVDTARGKREANVLRTLQHCPAVVRLKETVGHNGDRLRRLYVVMEFCGGGDLGTFLQENGPLNGEQALFVTKEVLCLLDACQKSGVLHGDIKPANFVIDSRETRNLLQQGQLTRLKSGWLKAIDFGTSQEVGLGYVTQPQGSHSYWAPEVFGKKFKFEADMWSVGVLLYHLMTGRFPFWDNSQLANFRTTNDLVNAIIKGEPQLDALPAACQSSQIDFLARLLVKDSRKRMNLCQALCHPWTAQFCGPSLERDADQH